MESFDQMVEEFNKEYPQKIRQFRRFGINAFMSRRNWGHDGISADAMIVVGSILNVNYKYEPEYITAHTATIGWYFGKGRWISLQFSWPR